MSENTTETRTVQNFRHDARRSLKQAQESITLRTDGTREVYVLVNGMIERTIAGRTGLTQDEQVESLTKAHDTLTENMAVLPEKIAEAKASVLAQVEAWETTILAKAQSAVDTLAEARDFAAERDFDAWQEEKRNRRSRGYSNPSGMSSDDLDDDPEPEDAEDDDLS